MLPREAITQALTPAARRLLQAGAGPPPDVPESKNLDDVRLGSIVEMVADAREMEAADAGGLHVGCR
jgi:hypothetical protein